MLFKHVYTISNTFVWRQGSAHDRFLIVLVTTSPYECSKPRAIRPVFVFNFFWLVFKGHLTAHIFSFYVSSQVCMWLKLYTVAVSWCRRFSDPGQCRQGGDLVSTDSMFYFIFHGLPYLSFTFYLIFLSFINFFPGAQVLSYKLCKNQ